MPSVTSVTIVFDSNVTKVELMYGGFTSTPFETITTSGNSYSVAPKADMYVKVYMNNSYILDNVVSNPSTNYNGEEAIYNITENTFVFNANSAGTQTITITSKKAASQVSIDLTTLSGWGNVANGQHSIQVVAKAENYRDSEKSTAVSFTKAPPLVTIPAGTYEFVDTPTTNWTTSYITDIAYKSNNVSYTKMYLGTDTLNNKGIGYNRYPSSSTDMMIGYVANHGWGAHSFNQDGEWKSVITNNDIKRITIETDQQVSQEFKTWFTANTTVVGAFTQVPVTLTNPFSRNISFNASNAPFGRISNMDKTKIYSLNYINGRFNYLSYNGTQWSLDTGLNISIKSQTETSVVLYMGISGGLTSSLHSIIALEGTARANVSDFTGYTGTEALPEYICLIEGTLVTLADGSTKPIEDITYDDELLVWNFYDGKFDKAKPCWIKKVEIASEYNLCKFSNGSEVGFVGEGGNVGYHRIYNDELNQFTHTGVEETPNGTHTFAQDETKPMLVSQKVVKRNVKFYNVITEKHYNLFANGILTSCRLSNKYAIKDMKYYGDLLISNEKEKEYFEKIWLKGVKQ